jgi:hypothetical protein
MLHKRRWAQFGVHSMRRDQVYAAGNGNISAALEHARAQLSVFATPEVYFDMGTLQTMMASAKLLPVSLAMDSFKNAQRVAYDAWVLGLKRRHPLFPLDQSRGVRCSDPAAAATTGTTTTTGAGGRSSAALAVPGNLVLHDWRRVVSSSGAPAGEGGSGPTAALDFPAALQPAAVAKSELTYGRGLTEPLDALEMPVEGEANERACAGSGRRYAFRQQSKPLCVVAALHTTSE